MGKIKFIPKDGKECNSCGEWKSHSEFGSHNNKGRETGSRKTCKSCEYEKRRNTEYQSKYGITLEEYNNLFKEQNGCCACCGKHQVEQKRRFAVDHCHETLAIRGLLCDCCNTAIGKLGDTIEGVENALNY